MQTDNLKGREDDERIDLIYSDHSEKEGSPMTRADQLSTEEEANDSQLQSEGKFPYSPNNLFVSWTYKLFCESCELQACLFKKIVLLFLFLSMYFFFLFIY